MSDLIQVLVDKIESQSSITSTLVEQLKADLSRLSDAQAYDNQADNLYKLLLLC